MLSKKLKCSINTIKSRLATVGVDFDIGNSGAYQMYHYECLPILESYLGVKRFTKESVADRDAFLSRLSGYLEEHPDQTFCRSYLYTHEEFRGYLLESKFQQPISQRLQCISHLAQRLNVEPVSGPCSTNEFSDILKQLDQIIFALSNYVDFDQPEDHASTANTVQNSLTPSNLVNAWCSELKEKRAEITDNGIITLNASRDHLIAALNDRLVQETLSKDEQKRAETLSRFLDQIHSWKMAAISPPASREALLEDIQKLMMCKTDAYLNAVFRTGEIPSPGTSASEWPPEFQPSTASRLDPIIIPIIENWYQQTMEISATLQHNMLLLQFCYKMSPDSNESTLNAPAALRHTAQLSLKKFWQALRGTYVREDITWSAFFSSLVDNLKYAVLPTPSTETKKRAADILLAIINAPDGDASLGVPQILLAYEITLEFFWQTHTARYADYYTYVYEQYRKVLLSSAE